MKRSNRKRPRPEEVVAKPRQADEAHAKGTPLAEVARSLGVSDVTPHRWRAAYDDDSRTKDAPRAAIAGSRVENRAAYVAMRLRIVEARAARAGELDAMRAHRRKPRGA